MAKTKLLTALGSVAALSMFAWSGTAGATALNCGTDPTKNYMQVDDSLVTECIDSGVGNINGNPATDDFLNSGGTALGWVDAGLGAWAQSGSSGTWSIDASLWNAYPAGTSLAIGFKFGTGNEPDEWFIYRLAYGVTSGDWTFINVFGKGGGLSHVGLYKDECVPGTSGCCPPDEVPEPASLGLLGLGLLGLGLGRRKLRG